MADGEAAVLAIDGGNSKTDLALVGWDGTVLASLRGPGASHEDYGIDGALSRLGDLIRTTAGKAGIDGSGAIAPHISACLAGADLPEEEAALTVALLAGGWSQTAVAVNDTFAVLRGGRQRVAAALLAHPLIGQYELAEKMTDRMLTENARFLSWA